MHQKAPEDPGPDGPSPDLVKVSHLPNVSSLYLSRQMDLKAYHPVTCFYMWKEDQARPKRMPGCHRN